MVWLILLTGEYYLRDRLLSKRKECVWNENFGSKLELMSKLSTQMCETGRWARKSGHESDLGKESHFSKVRVGEWVIIWKRLHKCVTLWLNLFLSQILVFWNELDLTVVAQWQIQSFWKYSRLKNNLYIERLYIEVKPLVVVYQMHLFCFCVVHLAVYFEFWFWFLMPVLHNVCIFVKISPQQRVVKLDVTVVTVEAFSEAADCSLMMEERF